MLSPSFQRRTVEKKQVRVKSSEGVRIAATRAPCQNMLASDGTPVRCPANLPAATITSNNKKPEAIKSRTQHANEPIDKAICLISADPFKPKRNTNKECTLDNKKGKKTARTYELICGPIHFPPNSPA